VPWLVLFATSVFAWGSLRRPSAAARPIGRLPTALMQFGISIYGGYFGGGIGFLMLAALTLAGLAVRAAGSTKNALAGAMNASAVVIFMLTAKVDWFRIALVAVAAMAGGVIGAYALKRVNEKALRFLVVIIGVALTIGLFLRAH
ncbi:MAG TPA: TSUP family transporter, partial [Caulobacteraceae bacterium]|nr:TSUP family transporter [Caulobacteraceae bacterium]